MATTKTPTGGNTSDTAVRVTAKEKQARALELRTGGASYQQIADTLGFRGGATYAHKVVRKALADIPREAVTEYRAVELARLDEVELRLRARLRQGDVSVASTLLRLSDQRAKLTGIYQAPEGMGDMTSLQSVFGGFMAGAQAFAAAQQQTLDVGELGAA